MNPADNPAEVERAKQTTQTNEKADTEDKSMEINGMDDPTDDSKVAENTEGTEWDLREMSVAHTDGNLYRVLSTRNNSINHYEVDVKAGTCDCPSENYNLEEHEACPHLTKALLVHKSQMDAGEMSTRDIQVFSERARNLLWDLRDATDFAKTLAENNARTYDGDPEVPADAKHDGAYKDDGGASNGSSQPEGIDTIAKMGELQSAFDDVVEDMQTEESGNLIWIQTGKDTPETIPGPGNVQVFDAFLKNPDQVEFIHDDHPRASDRPGQWWKNAIKPSQVDSYINEVLK